VTALLLQFGFRCIYYPESSGYHFVLDLIESNEATLAFSVHLPPKSLYRLADICQFPSRLSIEENEEFIV
jgi:hypothetical protein